MDVGATLRGARERRGLSIESLSRITRIKPDLLRAIEANAFEKLPGGIFRRGFLRSYAHEVGLDPELVVRGYLAEFEAIPVQQPVAPYPKPPKRRVHGVDTRPLVFDPAWLRPRVSAQWAAIALVVATFAGYTIVAPLLAARGGRSAPSVVPAGEAKANAQPAAALRATSAVATTGSALQVDIASTGPCWIAANADGQQIAYGLFQPGEHRTINVHDGLVLRVGDPGAFSYTINGVPGRPLGRAAEPITVRIAPHNFREFLTNSGRTGS